MSSHQLWKPGQSGNPAGRPKGSKNRKTKLTEAFCADAKAIVRKVVEAALAGDMQAANIVISRLQPPLKARAETVEFDLDTTKSLTEQAAQVLNAVAAGQVDPDTGQQIINSITAFAGLKQIDELEGRLSTLEGNAK